MLSRRLGDLRECSVETERITWTRIEAPEEKIREKDGCD
jgi:hypothetical protein